MKIGAAVALSLSFAASGFAQAQSVWVHELFANSPALPGNGVSGSEQANAKGLADAVPPRFELDPSWPKPLQDGRSWPELQRAATSVAADSRDHVWIFQVPSPAARQAEAAGKTVPRGWFA